DSTDTAAAAGADGAARAARPAAPRPAGNPNHRRANPNRRSADALRPGGLDPIGPAPDAAPDNEGTPVSGGFGTDLPHWTDPPTGEVPRILADRAGGGDDDLAAWEALGNRTTTWRDDTTGWHHVDDGLDDLIDDEAPLGALDTSRTEHSDLYSFDEDFERLEEERSGQHRIVAAGGLDDIDEAGFDEGDAWQEAPAPVRVGSRPRPLDRSGDRRRRPARRRPGAGVGGGGQPPAGGPPGAPAGAHRAVRHGAELGPRVVVGVGLVVLLLIATAIGPAALLVLAAAVVTLAAAEVFEMLRPSGFRPATLLGLAGSLGVVFAAYWRGPAALPLVTALVFGGSMCWYLFKVVDARPLANAAVTTTAFTWVGLLGSYAALLLRAPHGRGLFLGAVIPAVVADIVAFFVGRQMGSRPLAPSISPAKTWEGAIGGGVAAVVAGIVVGHSLSPWGGLKHGLVLGLAIAVLAPVGDLFESMVKRDLSVKDSGSVLSAHGGVLDRFDAVLLVLPAAYYLASWWHLVR
ncbi:MAG TPA: phosphatidate cytidylyltransferase, partial [Acidimicrobiales bacterium]|nr:phosphatidate cytidylyltransferase [Acidimicrobiales bacterium]